MPKKANMSYAGFGVHVSSKGYLRFSVKGPMNGQYVHRYVAEKMLGRKLKKDEQVHHKNSRKTDNRRRNLEIIGEREHGWVSAKQAFWMKLMDIKGGEDFHAYIEQIEAEGVSTGL